MKPEKYFDEGTGEVKVGKIIVYIFVVVLLVSAAIWGIRMITLPARTATDIVEKTLDADNVIYNYEWFKQIVEDIEAMEKKVAITKQSTEDFKELHSKPYDEWSFEDKQEMSRLRTDLRGQQAHFEQLKADLRARSKMANRTIFKGDNKIISWIDEVSGASDK
jgi:hypothetical protein